MESMMRTIPLIGSLLLALCVAMPAAGEDSLLYETWLTSAFDPQKLDRFIQEHEGQYTEGYFQCSQEAQRLIRDEANIRNRRCEFSGDSVLRDRCRQDNPFRGLDKHVAELDQAIKQHTPWLKLESGRKAVTADESEKACQGPACDIFKRKRAQVLRDLKPYLQCPPVAEPPSDVDPTFKDFKLPSDPGG
jgi:hypothetical protein